MDRSEQLRGIQWIKFRNDAGSTAPAGGILRVTGYNNDAEEPFLTIDQPNTFGAQYNHAINDDFDVASGEYGYCCLGQIVPALYDSADGTPAFGELWGPRASTWKLKKNTGGFRVRSTSTAGVSGDFRTLIYPEPFLYFRGVAAESITENTAGNVTVYIRTGATSYTSTSVTLSVLNDLDVNIETGATVHCVCEEYGTSVFWRAVNTDYTCPE